MPQFQLKPTVGHKPDAYSFLIATKLAQQASKKHSTEQMTGQSRGCEGFKSNNLLLCNDRDSALDEVADETNEPLMQFVSYLTVASATVFFLGMDVLMSFGCPYVGEHRDGKESRMNSLQQHKIILTKSNFIVGAPRFCSAISLKIKLPRSVALDLIQPAN